MNAQAIKAELKSIKSLAALLNDKATQLEKYLGAVGTTPRSRKGLTKDEASIILAKRHNLTTKKARP